MGEKGNRKIGCILLAAGRAERFGRNKLMEPLAGKPMITYVLDQLVQLRSLPDVDIELSAVTIWADVATVLEDYHIPCIRYEGGLQSDSIRIGLAWQHTEDWDGCMFLAGDQPLLRAESIMRLLRTFSKNPENVYRLCYRERQGSPIIFPAACLKELKSLQGDEGGRQIIRRNNMQVCCVRATGEEELFDVDTETDLEKIRFLLGENGLPYRY